MHTEQHADALRREANTKRKAEWRARRKAADPKWAAEQAAYQAAYGKEWNALARENPEFVAKRAEYSSQRYAERRDQILAANQQNRRDNPVAAMLRAAKSRAKKAGVPFSLTVADVVMPEICPILALRLVQAKGRPSDNSPSLDRIVPALGYVPGNVRVISNRANKLKSDGTREELMLVALWTHRMVGEAVE